MSGRQVQQESKVLSEPCPGIGWKGQSWVGVRKEGRATESQGQEGKVH